MSGGLKKTLSLNAAVKDTKCLIKIQSFDPALICEPSAVTLPSIKDLQAIALARFKASLRPSGLGFEERVWERKVRTPHGSAGVNDPPS